MIVAAQHWSMVGAAVAVLACAVVFEAVPMAHKLSAHHRSEGMGSKPVLRQAGAVICAGGVVVLLAWGRQRLGVAAIGLAAIGAVTAGLLTSHRILRYLAAARPVAGSQLAPEPGSLVPESGQKS
jgi:hypothetical protein